MNEKPGEKILEAVNVTKHYRMGNVTVKALDGVSIEIKHGEFLVIMGPSGSGKSTLLHLLGALDLPSSGTLLINGKDISQFDDFQLSMFRRNYLGFIFQTFNLVPTLNCLENVLVSLLPSGVKFEDEKHAVELLKLVELGHRINHRPNMLSGGERQRVSIARALMNDPPLLLADEPTGNLDSVSGGKIMSFLKDLNRKEGVTILIVTHDRDMALYADKIINIRDGKLLDVEVLKDRKIHKKHKKVMV
ncbi:MAG: ABC transporter ATP-binding protein [Candidatus Diapherotrites archaeon]|nr:ABC transporter ATP-binding protein [Candidatus Diapherotrites archaeon]